MTSFVIGFQGSQALEKRFQRFFVRTRIDMVSSNLRGLPIGGFSTADLYDENG